MKLTEQRVRDLLDEFSSSRPTPGGGSAAALASAVGASLLLMVAALPKTRTGADEERAALRAASDDLSELRGQLAEAIDADSEAYDHVVAAFKLPKGDENEQRARREAIQRATAGATRVPLAVMRQSAAALAHAVAVARHGNRSAASDVGVAVMLLLAGLRGARLNVDINLGGLKDEALVHAMRADAERFASDGERSATAAKELLQAG